VLAGEAAIFASRYFTNIAFLWHNVIGCGLVVLTGVLISNHQRPSEVGFYGALASRRLPIPRQLQNPRGRRDASAP